MMTTREEWLAKRDDYMASARKHRAWLQTPECYLYERVQKEEGLAHKMVGDLVGRARRCHNIALGRIPVIKNLVLIEGNTMRQGSVYVDPPVAGLMNHIFEAFGHDKPFSEDL